MIKEILMLKVESAPDYPAEEGSYMRGNDYSPVAVTVILKWKREETPFDIQQLVRVAIETGAALAGTLQTENIGLEKVICNVVGNPNIRYMVVCGPESPGHSTGEALLALKKNGVDERRKIIGTKSPTPYLFNIPMEFIERFRSQITMIDLLNEGSPELIRGVVWSCYQETPTPFQNYTLCDPGAWPEPPLSGKITFRVTHPEREPKDEQERRQVEKLQEKMEWIKKRVQEKKTNNT